MDTLAKGCHSTAWHSAAQPRPEKRPDAKTLFLGDVRIDVLDEGLVVLVVEWG